MSVGKLDTDRLAEKFREQPIADNVSVQDEGYIVVTLDRADTRGSIFQLIDLADYLDMDGKIEIWNDWMCMGERCDAVHFQHKSRFEGME